MRNSALMALMLFTSLTMTASAQTTTSAPATTPASAAQLQRSFTGPTFEASLNGRAQTWRVATKHLQYLRRLNPRATVGYDEYYGNVVGSASGALFAQCNNPAAIAVRKTDVVDKYDGKCPGSEGTPPPVQAYQRAVNSARFTAAEVKYSTLGASVALGIIGTSG